VLTVCPIPAAPCDRLRGRPTAKMWYTVYEENGAGETSDFAKELALLLFDM